MVSSSRLGSLVDSVELLVLHLKKKMKKTLTLVHVHIYQTVTESSCHMDAVDQTELKEILSTQQALLEQYDSILCQVFETQEFSASISPFCTQMDQLAAQRWPAAAPPLISSNLPREPYIPTLKRYSVDLETCAQFLHQYNLVSSQPK